METVSSGFATIRIVLAKLTGRKISYLFSFLVGAALMLCLTSLGRSNPPAHVYELRMYQVNDGKMDALIARFKDHTDAIFKHHNMKSVGFWRPEDAPYSQNLFVYILEHPSREEARKNWAELQADPEWKKVKAETEVNGPLAKHIDSYFMDPTSFSTLQ
ncbi:MAG TPA: NIPSNAP family protein [Pyrinomonadaceae bacterium]